MLEQSREVARLKAETRIDTQHWRLTTITKLLRPNFIEVIARLGFTFQLNESQPSHSSRSQQVVQAACKDFRDTSPTNGTLNADGKEVSWETPNPFQPHRFLGTGKSLFPN